MFERRELLVDLDYLQSNVVGTPAVPRHLHQFLAGAFRRLARHRLLDLFIADDAPQTIGAKHQPVPGTQLHRSRGRVGFHIAASAQRGGQDVALRVELRFFRTDDPMGHQPAHIRMILRQARDGRIPH